MIRPRARRRPSRRLVMIAAALLVTASPAAALAEATLISAVGETLRSSLWTESLRTLRCAAVPR